MESVWKVFLSRDFKELFVGSLLSLISDPALPLHKQMCILWTYNDTSFGNAAVIRSTVSWFVGESSPIFPNLHMFYIYYLGFCDFFPVSILLSNRLIYLVIKKAVYGLISLPTLYYYFMFYWKHTFLSFYWLLSIPIKQNQININPAWKHYVKPYIVPEHSMTP